MKPAVRSRSQSLSLLRLPSPTADIVHDWCSEDEAPLVTSTRATVHSALHNSHEVRDRAENVKENLGDDLNTFLNLPLPESLSPNLDAILPLIDSDDSLQDSH